MPKASAANCRPPEAALTVLGRWKQRNSGEATHLQLSAGSYKVPTAIAGSTGAYSVGLLFLRIAGAISFHLPCLLIKIFMLQHSF